MMTQQQINWAKQHDWFIAVLATGDGVLVLDHWLERDGTEHKQDRVFRDYRSLRNWAGY